MENQPTKRKLQAEKTAKLVLEYLLEVYNSTHNAGIHVIKSSDIKTDLAPMYKTASVKAGIVTTGREHDYWITSYLSTIPPNIHMARRIVESGKQYMNTIKNPTVKEPLTVQPKEQVDVPTQGNKEASFKNLKEDILKIKTNYEEQFGVKIDISISLSQHITL